MKGLACVLAMAMAAVSTVGQTVKTFNPPAFDARNNTNLVSMFAFENSGECESNLFQDGRTDAQPLGSMTYNGGWQATDKCPSATKGSYTFNNAYNGVRFQGTRQGTLPRDDAVTSSGAIGSSIFSDYASFEMWIMPDFSAGDDSNQYVLFEIGSSTFPAGTSFGWECDFNSNDFSARLVYVNSAAQFVLQYRIDGNNCPVSQFSSFVLTQGQLYHIVVVIQERPGVSGDRQVALYVDGSLHNARNDSPLPDLTSWTSSHVVRVGSSPATLSTSNTPDVIGINSWKGDIMFFAMYDDAMHSTQVATNFAAGLPNSRPAIPTANFVETCEEDTDTALTGFDAGDFIYDFEVDFLAPATQTLTRYVEGELTNNAAFGGNLFMSASAITTFPTEATSSVSYLQSIPNVYQNAQIRFLASASDSFADSKNATIEIALTPSNDAPTVDAKSYTFAQSVPSLFTLTGRDPDCGPTDTAASCLLGQAKEFHLVAPTTTLGKFYLPSSPGTCGEYSGSGDLSAGALVPSFNVAGEVTFELCFEGCIDEKANNQCPPGLEQASTTLGTVTLEYYLVDLDTTTDSVHQNITIELTNVLSVENDLKHMRIEENSTRVAILLEGTDNYCVNGNPGCPRTKEFVLTALPHPSQGYLYVNDTDEGILTSLPEDGLLLPNEQDTIYFKPADFYMNSDSWPQADSGSRGFTTTPGGQTAKLIYPCTGPSTTIPGSDFCVCTENPGSTGCSDDVPNPNVVGFRDLMHSTTDLEGNIMGCIPGYHENPTSATGCSVAIQYSLKVGALVSPNATGVEVWVQNINQAIELTGSFNQTGFRRNIRKKIEGLQLVDDDMDTRIVQVTMTVRSGKANVMFPDFSFDVKKGAFSNQFAKAGARELTMYGTPSELNLALADLHYQLAESIESDFVDIVVTDIASSRAHTGNGALNTQDLVQTRSYSLAIGVLADDTNEKDFTLSTIIIWSSIVAGSILCLGGCYGIISCCLRRAIAGEKAALWFVRNILFTKVDTISVDHEVEGVTKGALKAIHDERVRLERVQLCAHLCSCCIHYDHERDKNLPSEEMMIKAAAQNMNDRVASMHLPPAEVNGKKSIRVTITDADVFDWERHIHTDPKTGKQRFYYFNPKTNQSTWDPPTVKIKGTSKSKELDSFIARLLLVQVSCLMMMKHHPLLAMVFHIVCS